MNVRLDKWLQIARIFKTRTRATKACQQGRVRVNGSRVRAHRNLNIGDEIEVRFGLWNRRVRVLELVDRPVSKARARKLYEDHSPPRPRLDPVDRILRAPPEERESGLGRPTKKDRRAIRKLKGED